MQPAWMEAFVCPRVGRASTGEGDVLAGLRLTLVPTEGLSKRGWLPTSLKISFDVSFTVAGSPIISASSAMAANEASSVLSSLPATGKAPVRPRRMGKLHC